MSYKDVKKMGDIYNSFTLTTTVSRPLTLQNQVLTFMRSLS